MQPLILSRYSCDLKVDQGRLIVRQWNLGDLKGTEKKLILKPRQYEYDSIYMYVDKGNISVSALNWLSRYGVPITFLDLKGNIVNQSLSYQRNGELRIKQFEAYQKKRIELGRKIIEAKITRQQEVIDFLKQRYDIETSLNDQLISIRKANSTKEILGMEGIAANRYFEVLKSVLDFPDRVNGFTKRAMSAIEPINSLLNYGYSILESIVRHSLTSIGFETSIGFIHEILPGKDPLVYDFQEPYRFLIDLTVIRIIEQNILNKGDYTHTKDWVIRLKESGIQKFMDQIRLTFNTPVKYKGKSWKWDSVIDMKIKDFSKHLITGSEFDLSEPRLDIERSDDKEIREKIKNMSYSQWKAMGYSKGSLWYMKHNLKTNNFKVHKKSSEKL